MRAVQPPPSPPPLTLAPRCAESEDSSSGSSGRPARRARKKHKAKAKKKASPKAARKKPGKQSKAKDRPRSSGSATKGGINKKRTTKGGATPLCKLWARQAVGRSDAKCRFAPCRFRHGFKGDEKKRWKKLASDDEDPSSSSD